MSQCRVWPLTRPRPERFRASRGPGGVGRAVAGGRGLRIAGTPARGRGGSLTGHSGLVFHIAAGVGGVGSRRPGRRRASGALAGRLARNQNVAHPVRSSTQKTTPTGSDAGRRLGSVVRHPRMLLRVAGCSRYTTQLLSQPHTALLTQISTKGRKGYVELHSCRLPWSVPGAGLGCATTTSPAIYQGEKGGPVVSALLVRRSAFACRRSMLSPPGTRAVPSRSPTRRRPPGTRLPPRRRGRAPRSAAWCRQPLEKLYCLLFWKAHTGSWRVESAAGWRLIENCSVQSGSRPLSLLKLKIKEPGPHQLALR